VANVVLQQGDLTDLNVLRQAANAINMIHLYASPHTPAAGDTDGMYSAIEANFSGYAPINLGQWNPAFLNPQSIGEIDANQVVWTHNGGPNINTIYGCYVTDNTGHVFYAEVFDAPVQMNAGGLTLKYTPRLTCQTA
jgi:hypothetical protein